jgi:Protein of unknown function (DUF2809)
VGAIVRGRRNPASALALAIIITAGLASRVIHTGFVFVDKYLGDGLYAAMFYVILGLLWPMARLRTIVMATAITMTAFELFQLTGIPAQMSTSAKPLVRMGARLLGTEFSWLDLTAYAVGIAALLWLDLIMLQRRAIGQAQPR